MATAIVARPPEAGRSFSTLIQRRLADAAAASRFAWSPPLMLFVLGMHRSGTSCVTRVLNLMGVALGPVSLDPAPDGEIHWETPAINWINDEMLARTGHSWMHPPEHIQVSRHDVWRCRRALWELHGTRVGAVKDPRMVLTYEAWQRAAPHHAIVACLRHPMNVARSLQTRDGLQLADGLDLWYAYNSRLLDCVNAGKPVYWFDFDAGEGSVHRLANQLAATLPVRVTPEAISHFSPSVRHHVAADGIPGRVGVLYEELRSRAHAGA